MKGGILEKSQGVWSSSIMKQPLWRFLETTAQKARVRVSIMRNERMKDVISLESVTGSVK